MASQHPRPQPSLIEAAQRFLSKLEDPDKTGCWLWTGAIGADDYGRVKHAGVLHSAHRFAYELFKGPVPEDLCVLHRCDTPRCVNPTHLFLGTKEDNAADMRRKGREGDSSRRLGAGEVAKIRTLLAKGETKRAVAERFGVCRSTIQDLAVSGDRAANGLTQLTLFDDDIDPEEPRS